MPAHPALAFVVPAYNAAATLADTLRSVLAQTRGDWEAIVIDDGSTDETSAVARSARDARVRVHRQANRGLAGARNAGLERIAAPAVCFVDADDAMSPRYTERMLAALDGADLAPCWYRYVGPGLEDLGWTIPVGEQDLTEERFLEFNPLVVGGVCVRAESARAAAIDGEVFRTGLKVHEDWDLWLRMTKRGARWAHPVEEPLYEYRLRPDSMSMDLGLMWRVGCGLIEGAAQGGGAARGRRGWTVRNLARAVARDDRALVGELLSDLESLREDDAGVLAGALRWALCRQELIGPGQARGRVAEWKERVARLLEREPGLPEVLGRMGDAERSWDEVIGRAAGMLRPGDSLAIYGLGRNGREALAAAQRRGIPLVGVDDHPGAAADVPRIRPEALGDRHVVLVTPDDRAGILQRLARLGIGRVVLPEA